MAKDYYKTLGVNKNASEKEIKSAFRKLAKKHHPDANPNDKTAESRFKEINEAYEVLSDAEKRKNYDRYGTPEPPPFGRNGGGSYTTGGYTTVDENFDVSSIFDTFFGGRGRSAGQGNMGSPFGSNYKMRGEDIQHTVQISLQEAYDGAERLISKGNRTVRVNIPAGATDGTKVRLTGEGEAGTKGGEAGDLYLIIQVEKNNQFERNGDDLTTDVKVDMFVALLGGEAEVQTLGRPIRLKIPAGTQSGRKFRLTGKGMPQLKKPDTFGDLYARVMVQVPQHLSEEQRQLAENLRENLAGG